MSNQRYFRNTMLFGETGQAKLAAAKVLVVGAGGLGSPVLMYLAASGIGTIGIVDDDLVELSNLQRQIIHSEKFLEKPKVNSARNYLESLNNELTVQTYQCRLTEQNVLEIAKKYDLIVDTSDNYETKFMINDAAFFLQKPFIHAAIQEWEGQLFTWIPGKACYRCLFDDIPDEAPSTSDFGVLGSVAGVIGSLQVNEAIKYLVGSGELLTNKLLTYNALTTKFRTVEVSKNENCSGCS